VSVAVLVPVDGQQVFERFQQPTWKQWWQSTTCMHIPQCTV